ncbi:hypothetical protein EJ04DRAFT_585319 [Polyplosphaeria fusca]|uniref:F-box domain-containing protein n=1 Tax=Polyplosphaeria fusca TaxID=682080 RepID=A0A9P4QTM1_9PLEO|nr:hypothetical protein EJ04DRAFT_585319 [Polyplosphaeria fusca]
MSLLSLPPELLCEVLNWSLPESFESLSLTCRKLYKIAQPLVPIHNSLRKRWQHDTGLTPRRGDSLRVLYEIALEPLVPRYIKRLNLQENDYVRWDIEYQDTEAAFRSDSDAMELIRKVVCESPYLKAADVDLESWWEEIEKESQSNLKDRNFHSVPFAIVSLLLFLPRIRELQLPRQWAELRLGSRFQDETEKRLIQPVMNALTTCPRTSGFEGKSLHELERILPHSSPDYERRAELQNLEHFLLLPNIREVFTTNCTAVNRHGGGAVSFDWTLPYHASRIRRIELAYSCMDPHSVSLLLSRVPSVEVFKYGHDIKWHGLQGDWNAARFVEAIAQCSGPRLLELAITVHSCLDMENGVTDFHAFKQLQKLEIDATIINAPPVWTGQRRGHDWHVPEGAARWTCDRLPCLATMLPPSLEELEINFDHDIGHDGTEDPLVDALTRDFASEREKRLPNLRKALWRQYRSDNARKLVESQGCSHEKFKGLAWDTMPRWVREFSFGIKFARD